MRTALVSDLHLGSRREKDLLRRPDMRARLWGGLEGVDRLVLLGDTLELRELPQAAVLDRARPFFDELAATEVAQVVLVAGNHDHRIAEPFLEAHRVEDPDAELSFETSFDLGAAAAAGIAGGIAAGLGGKELLVAYPGVRVRDDVVATHGHYLDAHMTVPTTECVSGRLAAKLVGGLPPDGRSVADYEAALAPLYAFTYALAQSVSPAAGRMRRGDTLAAEVWERVNGDEGGVAARLLLGRVALPAGVALLNRLGLGPFSADLSPGILHRAGLRAMAAVAHALALDAEYLIFGHIHRAGPLPRDDRGDWRIGAGPSLVNCGTWSYDDVFLAPGGAERNPYWPGTIVYVDEKGPPEVANLLADVGPAELGG